MIGRLTTEMWKGKLKFVFERGISVCLFVGVKNNFVKSVHTQTSSRFDTRILNYIRSDGSFQKTTVKTTDKRRLDGKVKESFDNFFDRRKLEKTSTKSFVDADSSIRKLPYYILEVGREREKQPGNNDILGILSMCDFHCSKISQLQFSEEERGICTCLKILDSWMHVLDHYYLVTDLQCYPNLIKQSTREVISSLSLSSATTVGKSLPELIHLAFVASLGKKSTFESHEVLSQLAFFCSENPECTYKTWTDFESAVMCSSFFRSGIKIESSQFLHEISSRLSEILESYLISGENIELDVSVVICLLKVLRQANFIEDRVLSGVHKLIMDKDKGEDILRSLTVLSHFMSAFSSSPINRQMTLDSSLVRVLNRAEHLVNTTLRFEEEAATAIADHSSESQSQPLSLSHSSSGQKRMTKKNAREVHPSVKSRLKDISRWLWSAASLGYQPIRGVQAYDADFTRRFSNGDFPPGEAVEALLALAIMNHYPESIVTKVLHSLLFRSALKVRCHRRQKVRFALFLTLVKIERNDLWRQLSPYDMSQLEDIAPRSWIENQEWTTEPYDLRKEKFANHCRMINQCMESLSTVFDFGEVDSLSDVGMKRGNYVAKEWDPKELESHNEKSVQIRRGYAVPYLFIPGIKIDFVDSGKTLFIEVLDTESFSQGFLRMKLRILSQLGNAVLYITPDEIKQCPDLGQFFKRNISNLLPE